MGPISQWLMHDDQKDLWELIYATIVNVLFLVLITLLLWPLGRLAMVLSLLKGYWVFWIVLIWTAILLRIVQRTFRLDLDSHFDAYVLTALALSGFLQAGWSAFAALVVERFVAGASAWVAATLYVVGFLSCYVAYTAVCSLYMGSIYRLVNLVLAFLCFIVFSVWPAIGLAVYGWFFRKF